MRNKFKKLIKKKKDSNTFLHLTFSFLYKCNLFFSHYYKIILKNKFLKMEILPHRWEIQKNCISDWLPDKLIKLLLKVQMEKFLTRKRPKEPFSSPEDSADKTLNCGGEIKFDGINIKILHILLSGDGIAVENCIWRYIQHQLNKVIIHHLIS